MGGMLKFALKFIGTVVLFALAARVGLMMSYISTAASPVWPATGIAIGAIVLFGKRVVPAVFIGTIFANTWGGTPVAAAAALGVGAMVEGLIGAWIYAKVVRKPEFEYQREAIAVVVTSLLASISSAAWGTSVLMFQGVVKPEDFWNCFSTWWSGDALGALVVLPFLTAFEGTREEPAAFRLLKAIPLLALAFALSSVLFMAPQSTPFIFAIFPVLLIAAHFAHREILPFVTFSIMFVGIFATLNKFGPFSHGEIGENLVHLQVFLTSVGVTSLVIGGFKEVGKLHRASLVLMTGWVLCGLVFFSFHKKEADQDRARFQELVSDAEQKVRARMAAYEEAVRAGVALFAADPELTRDEFRRFVETLDVKRYPGFSGIGVSFPVQRGAEEAFKKFAASRGVPDLKIKEIGKPTVYPPFDAPSRSVLIFFEPLSPGNTAIGLDLGSELNRRQAAEIARDSGKPSLSARLKMSQNFENQMGYIFSMPVYRRGLPTRTVEERRAALMAWVHAPFVADRFFGGLFDDANRETSVYVHDGGSRESRDVVFRSDISGDGPQGIEKFTFVEAGQRGFTLGWKRGPGFVSKHDTRLAWAGLCGALLTLILATLFVNHELVNQRAQVIADDQTASLQQHKRKLRETMRVAPVGLMQLDATGAVVYVNDYWLNITGQAESSNIDAAVAEAIHPDDRAAVREEWDRSYAEGRPFMMTYRILSRDRGTRWVDAKTIALVDEDGKLEGYVAAIQDITDEKMFGLKLQEKNIELDAALRHAEEATLAKSQFLANMTHEIRTPLNAIVGMAEFLSTSSLPPVQKDYAETLATSAENLLELISGILDFSKIEAGKMTLEAREFKLHDSVISAAKTFSFLARQKALVFEVIQDYDRNTAFVGDSARVIQVLNNLMSNAIKFTSKGSVQVRVRQIASQRGYARMRFEVEDTGIGIPRATSAKLFQAFTQGDASTTRQYGGTGLGLFICKKLVDLMDGDIGVVDRDGGAKFWFEIPFRVARPMLAPAPAGVAETRRSDSLRVLVAEDNLVNQKVALAMLGKLGHQARTVSNGREALEALRAGEYDVVLMDCQMPELDGYEATRLLRTTFPGRAANIPVIAMTANAVKGDRERCLEAGMDEYVTKPVKLQELQRTIEICTTARREAAS